LSAWLKPSRSRAAATRMPNGDMAFHQKAVGTPRSEATRPPRQPLREREYCTLVDVSRMYTRCHCTQRGKSHFDRCGRRGRLPVQGPVRGRRPVPRVPNLLATVRDAGGRVVEVRHKTKKSSGKNCSSSLADHTLEKYFSRFCRPRCRGVIAQQFQPGPTGHGLFRWHVLVGDFTRAKFRSPCAGGGLRSRCRSTLVEGVGQQAGSFPPSPENPRARISFRRQRIRAVSARAKNGRGNGLLQATDDMGKSHKKKMKTCFF